MKESVSPPLSLSLIARRVIIPFLLTRFILVAVGFVALTQLKPSRETKVWEIGADGQVRKIVLVPPEADLSAGHYWMVDIFSRWDAEWYLDLAKNGYHYQKNRGRHSNTAFFPLYPSLMAAISTIFGARTDVAILISGLVLSNLALLVALVYLMKLVRLDFDEETAARSVLFLLVFPSTFFFSAVYTESLFLAAVVIAFYQARRQRWLLAGLAGAAATLTRPPGVLLFAALAFEYLYQVRAGLAIRTDLPLRAGLAVRVGQILRVGQAFRRGICPLLLIPLALAGHFGYMQWKIRNFWIFFQTEKDWGRAMVGAPGRIASFAHFSGGDLLIGALSLGLIILGWKRLRPSYGVYATLAFLMPLASGTLLGMGRFCAIIFPIYIVMGLLGGNRALERNWLIVSSSMSVLFMAMFSLWRYVG